MRRFLIYYWIQLNDEPKNLEIIVKADDMEQALKEFNKEVTVRKEITTITELTYV